METLLQVDQQLLYDLPIVRLINNDDAERAGSLRAVVNETNIKQLVMVNSIIIQT